MDLEKEKHVFDVKHEERRVKRFEVYISKGFWNRIGVEDGDVVDVAFWESTGDLRIKPIKRKVVRER